MRGFTAGIIFAVVLAFAVAVVLADGGYLPTSADAEPSSFERRMAMSALDASMNRAAPRIANPVKPLDDNLIDGMKIYTMNCAVCHGTMDLKPSVLEHSMYPPPPQLLLDPLDDPEWHIYYAIRTGVRYTGMPSWSKALSNDDMWRVTAFLSRVDHLPPAVKDAWQKAYGTAAPGPRQEQQGAHEHHD